MQLILGSRGLSTEHGPYAVGMGIFDGVHIGHQKLLSRVRELAQRDGIASLAYTFHPHPASVLSPEKAPPLIEPLEMRLEHIAQLGLSATLVETFDQDFAQIPPERFVEEVIVKKLETRHLVVGTNFTFGRKAAGNVAMLERSGQEYGFQVHPIELVQADGAQVSSTKAREAVAAGRLEEGNRILGRPFALSGVVVRGAGRGRGMGYPTANLQVHNELVPQTGVYAGIARTPAQDGKQEWPAAVNIGFNPTFEEDERLSVEAFLLDYEGQPLYGLPLSLALLSRLRAEERFESVEALQNAMADDVERTRRIVAQYQREAS